MDSNHISLACTHTHTRAGTVKRELSFQQAICYLSFRSVNILHAWTENSVNRLVKNSKHNTAITSSLKPYLYPFAWQAISQECQNYLSASQMTDYWLVMQMRISVRLGWKGDCSNVFWISEFTVHACTMFTHLKLR